MRRGAMWLAGVAAVAITTAVGVPLASAHPSTDGAPARSAATSGLVYGGVTSQDWPVVLELNRSRRRIVRADIALQLNCTSGRFARLRDRYIRITVNRRRRFGASFGPETVRNDDGTTTDFEGSIGGSLNRARSRASGTWRLKFTDHDAAGVVVDTCDSGSVRWSAKQ